MYLILIIALLGILLYLTYRIHSAVSSISETMKILTEDTLITIGGLYPVFSQHEMIEARKKLERCTEDDRKVAQHYFGLDEEKLLQEALDKGKSLDGLKVGAEEMYKRLAWAYESKVEYEQMALANLDVFHGRKTIEQAKKDVGHESFKYSWGAERWNELMKEKEEYLQRIQSTYDKIINRGVRVSEKKEG